MEISPFSAFIVGWLAMGREGVRGKMRIVKIQIYMKDNSGNDLE